MFVFFCHTKFTFKRFFSRKIFFSIQAKFFIIAGRVLACAQAHRDCAGFSVLVTSLKAMLKAAL